MFACIDDKLTLPKVEIYNDTNILTRKIYIVEFPWIRYLYTGIQYDLLGLIITNVSGIPYQTYTKLNWYSI